MWQGTFLSHGQSFGGLQKPWNGWDGMKVTIWMEYHIIYAGWWFATWILFFHILGIAIPTVFHIFQRGWNDQPGIYIYITGMNRYQYTVTWISSTGLLYITGLFCFFCWVCHVSSAEGDDAEAFVFWPQRAVPFPRLKITAWRWLDSTPKDCHAF